MDNASVFTSKGHRVEHVVGLLFRCTTRAVNGLPPACFQTAWLVSQLDVALPCTLPQLRVELRAWLSPRHDEELVAQADELAAKVLDALPSAPPLQAPQTPPPPPVVIN
jgi:hypothetical protein